MAKTTEKKKEVKKALCHECLESYTYKELNSVRKDSDGFFYTVLVCQKCCDELKIEGEKYTEVLKERRKMTSDIMKNEDKS